MKEKLQTKFATRQYMISDTFELYYYSTDDVPGVKEHTHTHYEFYLFLEGAISLEIGGVLYTPTPGSTSSQRNCLKNTGAWRILRRQSFRNWSRTSTPRAFIT